MTSQTRNLMMLALVQFCAASFIAESVWGYQQEAKRPTVVGAEQPERPAPARVAAVKLSEEEQQKALDFASQHHPELADLLRTLQKNSPPGFAKGIREVHMVTQRLDRLKEKQPARLEAEIKSWKVDSEIRLLTAKWLMSRDPALEAEIRELLRQRQQGKIDRLNAERNKLAERLQQLDEQIGMDTTQLEADLVEEWNRLSRRGGANPKTTKSAAASSKSKSQSPEPIHSSGK